MVGKVTQPPNLLGIVDANRFWGRRPLSALDHVTAIMAMLRYDAELHLMEWVLAQLESPIAFGACHSEHPHFCGEESSGAAEEDPSAESGDPQDDTQPNFKLTHCHGVCSGLHTKEMREGKGNPSVLSDVGVDPLTMRDVAVKKSMQPDVRQVRGLNTTTTVTRATTRSNQGRADVAGPRLAVPRSSTPDPETETPGFVKQVRACPRSPRHDTPQQLAGVDVLIRTDKCS